MENKKFFLDSMQKEALYVYLEFCHFSNALPNKEVYDIILNDDIGTNLDDIMSYIELEHGNIKKGKILQSDKERFSERFIEKFQLNPREMSHKVCLDEDSERMVEQFVNYDPKDKWICLTHDSNEISLSLENWYKLSELATRVLNYRE